jgi:hypothetical protein
MAIQAGNDSTIRGGAAVGVAGNALIKGHRRDKRRRYAGSLLLLILAGGALESGHAHAP